MEQTDLEKLDLKQLEMRRISFQDRAFRLVLEVAFIFGIPAAIAYFLGRYLDASAGTERKMTLICLAFSFVISWIIMIVVYRKIDRELKTLDKLINEKRLEERNEDDD